MAHGVRSSLGQALEITEMLTDAPYQGRKGGGQADDADNGAGASPDVVTIVAKVQVKWELVDMEAQQTGARQAATRSESESR